MPILPWEPLHTGVPLRTRRVLGLPVKDELRRRHATFGACLPTPIRRCRSNEIDPMLRTAGDQMIGAPIARINDLLTRYQVSGRKLCLNMR